MIISKKKKMSQLKAKENKMDKDFTIRCMRCGKFIRKESFWDAFQTNRELCNGCSKQFQKWIKKGKFAEVSNKEGEEK